jgi:ABC-type transporter Mla subunit MlaD
MELLLRLFHVPPQPNLVRAFWLCAGIVLISFVAWLFMSFRYLQSRKHAKKFMSAIASTSPLTVEERADGIPLERINTLQFEADELSSIPRRWWATLRSALARHSRTIDEERWFLLKPVHQLLTEEEVLGGFGAGWIQAVPGLLTSIGLTCTFFMIVLGLQSLHYSGADVPIAGLEELINALSGKFWTSIAALSCSLLFIVFREIYEHRLVSRYQIVCRTLDDRIPVLRTESVLLEIYRSTAMQETSLSHISSDLVGRLTGILKVDLFPALAGDLAGQISPALEAIRTVIERLESQKQESITGELRTLIDGLQSSLTEALREMGRQFHEQLAGGARDEFGNVQKSLSSAADAIQQAMVKFDFSQQQMAEIIRAAGTVTEGQMNANQRQVEAMTQLMEGLMRQLSDSTGSSMKSMSLALAGVVDDLKTRIDALTITMAETVSSATAKSAIASDNILARVEGWSQSSEERLAKIAESFDKRLDEIGAAGSALKSAQSNLVETLGQSRGVLDSFASAASQVQAYTTALGGLSRNNEELQKQQVLAISNIRQAVDGLRSAGDASQGLLERYQATLQNYKGVFDTLDQKIEGVLTAINRGMQDYVQTAENNFRGIVSHANSHLPKMTESFDGQIHRLSEQLEDLTEALDKGIKNLRDRQTSGRA